MLCDLYFRHNKNSYLRHYFCITYIMKKLIRLMSRWSEWKKSIMPDVPWGDGYTHFCVINTNPSKAPQWFLSCLKNLTLAVRILENFPKSSEKMEIVTIHSRIRVLSTGFFEVWQLDSFWEWYFGKPDFIFTTLAFFFTPNLPWNNNFAFL